ncbi:hypothetical protein A3L09_07405 [Thermococcus profundus]|uniref:Uncharacterized protein n=1 Tax=Thermococcus profundus TaxID=49899 RepID=A0A2Z2MKY7_THEPR|nr:hypothetical protein [Thermococcus profundus]ASJ03091.1 hypothetical protein A3L09_07405 [Thermococcus profundus]
MKITVRPSRGWRKVVFKISDKTFERIERLSKRYGFRTDEALRIILLHGYVERGEGNEGVFRELEEEISELERELYELEGKWSPLKFKTYYLAMDNQNLAIQLSGMIAENRRLRKMLGKPERDFSEVEGLIHYYLSFGGKD